MDVDPEAMTNGNTQPPISKKRLADQMDAENEEELVDRLLPAAAAMKRRRIEAQEEAARTGKPVKPLFAHPQTEVEAEIPKKVKKEINIKEATRERLEAEENEARREEEDLREDVDGLDVEGMRNLAVIEEMELPDHTNRPQRKATDGIGSRWDDRWNGLKNFKRFRRHGEGMQARRGRSVIVPLEEVKNKDFGIGEEYWLSDDKLKTKRRAKERVSQFEGQPYTSEHTAVDEALVDIEGEDTLGAIDVETLEPSTNRAQFANGKRPAPDRGRGSAAKKQKMLAAKDSDSESEDELKFRFKKRR